MSDTSLKKGEVEVASYESKEKWESYRHFIVATISLSLGFWNLWMFPYRCHKHGGIAFITAFVVTSVFIGVPFLYMQLALGQYTSNGPVKLFYGLGPAWRGIGVSQCLLCFANLSYYCYMVAIVFTFMTVSFQTQLPWEECAPKWGANCVPTRNMSSKWNPTERKLSSTELYFRHEILKSPEGKELGGFGPLDWHIGWRLLAIWIAVYFSVAFGLNAYARLSYFLVGGPLVALTSFALWSVSLDGAVPGLRRLFFAENWRFLAKKETWMQAMIQCVCEYGTGYGTASMVASYNPVHFNIGKSVMIIASVSFATDIISTIFYFSMLGRMTAQARYLSDYMWILSFDVYSEAISAAGTPHRYLLSVLIFAMATALCFGTLTGMLQVNNSNLLDHCPILRTWQSLILCVTVGFCLGMSYTTPGGVAIATIVKEHGMVYNSLLLITFQFIAVCYTFGVQFWCWDVEYMTKKPVGYFMRWSWAIIVPCCTFCFFGLRAYTTFFIVIPGVKRNFALGFIYVLLFGISSPVWLFKIYYFFIFRTGLTTGLQAMYESNFTNADVKLGMPAIRFRREKYDSYPYRHRSKSKQFFMTLIKIL